MIRFNLSLFLVSLLAVLSVRVAFAQDEGKPFDFPIAGPAGPSTWLLGQPYGNTVGAYFNRALWYEAGQGLHFGIDISAECGTPVVAVADATVMFVDDPGFGSGPYNLILRHDAVGLTTLYGHLLQPSDLQPGQSVARGQVVGYSGDPDETCYSRPHLHFEVRSLDYFTAYNPVDYINAAWHSLSNVGPFSYQIFERDFNNPRQWVTLFDQPSTAFGGPMLNNYAFAWPGAQSPPPNAILPRQAAPLVVNAAYRTRRIGYEGCCFWPWWDPVDPNRLYTIDGSPGQRAGVFFWNVGGSEPPFDILRPVPPAYTSPDGSIEVSLDNDTAVLRNASNGSETRIFTDGEIPVLSTDNRYAMWVVSDPDATPPDEPPLVTIWVADANGANARAIATQPGGYAQWLDATRLLQVASRRQQTTLMIVDVTDGSATTLGTWARVRGLTVAPGGGRVLYYLMFQDDPAADGTYTLETRAGAAPVKLPWFGSWRWRDADSVYYIPFDPTTNGQALAYYHILTGQSLMLTDPAQMPFTVANGDWSVSADGRRIVFLNANDLRIWLLEPTSE